MITGHTGYLWWSCRYGILTTPQTNPSDDRIKTQETHMVEINVAKQLLKRNIAMHKRDASKSSK